VTGTSDRGQEYLFLAAIAVCRHHLPQRAVQCCIILVSSFPLETQHDHLDGSRPTYLPTFIDFLDTWAAYSGVVTTSTAAMPFTSIAIILYPSRAG